MSKPGEPMYALHVEEPESISCSVALRFIASAGEYRDLAVGVPKEQVARDLRDSARLIEERGWLQGDSVDDRGRVCAIGAVFAVTGTDSVLTFHAPAEMRWKRQAAAVCAVADYLGVPVLGGVPEWNDESARRMQDVLDVFEKAALRVEEQA